MEKSTLTKRLAQYAALASSVIAGTANGQVVYTNLHDHHLNKNSNYPIDLDGDSIVDVTFDVKTNQTTSVNGQFNLASVKPGVNDMVVHASHQYPNPLSKSYMIGASAYFVLNSFSRLAGWFSSGEGPYSAGLFRDWNEHYVGLKFHNASGVHYGWVRVKINYPATTMDIYDYAYEKTPGKGILAGDTCGKPAALITLAGSNLVASAATAYQWYLNGNIIIGATSQLYTPFVNGDYTVEVTNSLGCSSVSPVFALLNAGIDEAGYNNELGIFPNPANEVLSIEYKLQNTKAGQYMVYDAMGQMLLSGSFAKEEFQINISSLAKGVYLLKVEDGVAVEVQKFVKE